MVTKEEIIRILEGEEEFIMDPEDDSIIGTVVWNDKFGFIASRIKELITSKQN